MVNQNIGMYGSGSGVDSVTRFGEISPNWQCSENFWAILKA